MRAPSRFPCAPVLTSVLLVAAGTLLSAVDLRPAPARVLAAALGAPISARAAGNEMAPTDSAEVVAAQLMAINPATPAEREEHVRRCQQALARFPGIGRNAEFYRHLGDVYFCLNRTAAMEACYRKAVELKPSLGKTTSIDVRLQELSWKRTRLRGAGGSLIGFLVLLVLMAWWLLRDPGRFELGGFLRRAGLFLAIYLVASGLFLFLDGRAAARWVLSLSPAESGSLGMIPPVIPLNILDGSRAGRAALILLYGFLPILSAVFAVSFRRSQARWMALLLVALTAGSLWTHFYFTRIYDLPRNHAGFVRGGRLYLRDEPEELLLRNPAKALRANPGLLNSDNDDLREFLESHYPDGLDKPPRSVPASKGEHDDDAR